jgi:hypothetical protein
VKNENRKCDNAGVEAIFRREDRGLALAERFVRGRERNSTSLQNRADSTGS